ncbi:MAG: hypothetical protein KY468_16075 [Armatimonadetes bacterium]|nr:hypothetical protein [Armatimonadota bacterium]
MDSAYGDSRVRIERENAADLTRDVEIQPALNILKDRVHWSAIIAGLVAAITAQMLFSLLGIATGLTTINLNAANPFEVSAANFSQYMTIWSAVSALVAFFLGGWIAGRTAATFSRSWGALNGAMVFLLAVPLTLWLASSGIGALFGSLGNFASMLSIDPAQVREALSNASNMAVTGQAAPNISPEALANAAAVTRNAALGALLAMVLGLIASALGGMLGTRRAVEVHPATGEISD